MIVSWFSAGVSSAVATKIALEKYPDLKIIYIDIEDHHPDSLRFVTDCQTWFNHPIEILRSRYGSVHNVITSQKYVNGPTGAPCTRLLKKRVRTEWEQANNPTTYIWGMDCSKREQNRAQRLIETMPDQKHIFPLIEKSISKEMAHGMLKHAGIKRPAMYDLGYPNNNCIGCVKGAMGYWNKIRIDFPNVFASRAKDERTIGASCIKGTFLDELLPDEGREQKIVMEDCGIFCEIPT